MHRRNFARRSGVVVDTCAKHGVWFDAEELPQLIRWVQKVGLAKIQEAIQSAEEQPAVSPHERAKKAQTKRLPDEDGNSPLIIRVPMGDIAGVLREAFQTLLRAKH